MLGDSVKRRSPARQPRFGGEPPRRRPRWVIWVALSIAALTLPFAAGYVIAATVLFPAPEAEVVGVPVPELVGLDIEGAEATLADAGLAGIQITRLPHPLMPEGVVTAQSPLPGQQLRAGSGVRVAVSTGVPRVFVPDVTGFSSDRAAALLDRLGFDVLLEDAESDAARGRVLRVVPRPGTEWPLPHTVQLFVSLGPPEPLDTIIPFDTVAPDVRGDDGRRGGRAGGSSSDRRRRGRRGGRGGGA